MFCYSVIKVFSFLLRKLLHFITSLYSCQELFQKNFFHLLSKIFVFRDANFYILSHDFQSVKKFFHFLLRLKMSTLNSTFFHVFIVLPFCTIRSLFYCVFSLLDSAVVRLPLLPASHVPYFCSYASCFTSSSNSSPAEW